MSIPDPHQPPYPIRDPSMVVELLQLVTELRDLSRQRVSIFESIAESSADLASMTPQPDLLHRSSVSLDVRPIRQLDLRMAGLYLHVAASLTTPSSCTTPTSSSSSSTSAASFAQPSPSSVLKATKPASKPLSLELALNPLSPGPAPTPNPPATDATQILGTDQDMLLGDLADEDLGIDLSLDDIEDVFLEIPDVLNASILDIITASGYCSERMAANRCFVYQQLGCTGIWIRYVDMTT
jgi:hypothetical protein